jgi:hypothetical protein
MAAGGDARRQAAGDKSAAQSSRPNVGFGGNSEVVSERPRLAVSRHTNPQLPRTTSLPAGTVGILAAPRLTVPRSV